MTRYPSIFLAAATLLAVVVPQSVVAAGDKGGRAKDAKLVDVAKSDRQWTGLAISNTWRVFVNFPRWEQSVTFSVGELNDSGEVVPYPDESTNRWQHDADPKTTFVCVQSVYVDDTDRLWILDPANPMFAGVVEDGAKLVEVDLSHNTVVRTFIFDTTIAPRRSYLNDVRVDTRTETAFITDSGTGAIIVVELEENAVRRVLDDHVSTRAESTTVSIDGRPVPMVVHSDGIALDSAGGWLYYQALTGRTLYRVPTEALRDDSLNEESLESKVEKFAVSGVSDGLLFGPGGIYISSIEDGAIRLVDNEGNVKTVVQDDRIVWPDSFALAPDGSVWFTTSQIHLGPNPPTPYRILKIPVEKK